MRALCTIGLASYFPFWCFISVQGTWMIVSAMVMGCIPFLSMRPKASASKEHDYKFTEHKPSSMVDIEATMM